MNDSPLRAALRKLLAQGEMAADNNLKRSFAPKAEAAPSAMCPECKEPLEEGKCAKCGYEEKGEDESALAEALEQGGAEG